MHSKMLAMLEPKDAAQESIMDAVRALSGDTKREAEATAQPVGQMASASALDSLLADLNNLGLSFVAACSNCGCKVVEVDEACVISSLSSGEPVGPQYCGRSPSCCP